MTAIPHPIRGKTLHMIQIFPVVLDSYSYRTVRLSRLTHAFCGAWPAECSLKSLITLSSRVLRPSESWSCMKPIDQTRLMTQETAG